MEMILKEIIEVRLDLARQALHSHDS